jgi:hypothetical protein
MTREAGDTEEIPRDWDTLAEHRQFSGTLGATAGPPDDTVEPPPVTLMATAWADLVAMLAVCTGALVAVIAIGQRPAMPAFGWAAMLALGWWIFAAAILVVVRHGTPGMVLAGVRFADAVAPSRVPRVLAAALLGAVTLGAPALLGSRLSPLAKAASSRLECDG